MSRDDCFLGVAAIFNRFGLSIRNGAGMKKGRGKMEKWAASRDSEVRVNAF
jgi:hypothetical protein